MSLERGTGGLAPKNPSLTRTDAGIIFQSGNVMRTLFGKHCSDGFLLCWPQHLLLPAPWSWGTAANPHVHTGMASWRWDMLIDPDLLPCAVGRGEKVQKFNMFIHSAWNICIAFARI